MTFLIVSIVIALYILTLVLCVVFIIWGISTLTHPKAVPFVPAKMRAIKYILDELQVPEGAVVYDIGCGDGRVLFEMYKVQPNATYIGIEKNFFPYLIAKGLWIKAGRPQAIKIFMNDVFKVNISDATHIYTYLLPDFMDSLIPKFKNELQPGTKLVSLQFAFSEKKPSKTTTFQPGILGQKSSPLYTYDF